MRLTAPPVEGKANQALLKLLAKTFQVSQSQVDILRGHSSRIKHITIGFATAAHRSY